MKNNEYMNNERMTREQRASFIFSQSVAALAEIEGMKAEERYRDVPLYRKDDFTRVIDKYDIGRPEQP